jgi:hypothetical protein
MSKEKSYAVSESGPRVTGKENHPTVTRRDSHEAKKAGKAEHLELVADQRIDGREVGTLGTGSFPVKSTAARQEGKAVEKQISSNRPGIAPKEKK